MNQLINQALRELEQRPDLKANPAAREWLRVLREGDSQKGEQIARNILSENKVTIQQAMEHARRMFGC